MPTLTLLVILQILSGCDKKPTVYRVGIISGAPPFANIAEGFKAKLTELGYLEGKNIIFDVHDRWGMRGAAVVTLYAFIPAVEDVII